MRILLVALVLTFSLACYIILRRRAYGPTTALFLLGIVSIIYWLIIAISSPPLPVRLLKAYDERINEVELTANAEVVIGELSPGSHGAMLTGPEAGIDGEKIGVLDTSLSTARYTFPKNKTAYLPGDRVWIRYTVTRGVLELREIRPARRPATAAAGGVLLLLVGILRVYKEKKKAIRAR